MAYRAACQAIFILLLSGLCSVSQAQSFTHQVVTGLSSPVFVTSPPGDDERLFLLEKDNGNVRVIDLASEQMLSEPYVTVSNLSRFGEKGLLGLAFHPDFADNGRFYVYASQRGGTDHSSQVFEYTASDPMSNTVDVSTQRSILRFDQPFGNHNGGWIGFDPSATGDARTHLYIATGDGGSARDPQNNSQDTTSNLLGKLLRIDVQGDDFASDTQNYSIPLSNPFVGSNSDDEIFAYGLRNPWRVSFDRANGDIWIGDVGQGAREEIDLLPAGSSGQNYGWRVMEGTRCFDTGDSRDGNLQCDAPTLVEPVYEYAHNESAFGGRSVTGGYVYRGPVREFQGQYFFADFATGHLWTLDPDSGEVLNRNDELAADRGQANDNVASFGEDNAGNLYVVNFAGSLYRVDSASRDAVWDGAASVGAVGDGLDWEDSQNWSRDGVADVGFESGDHLILDKNGILNAPDDLSVAALTVSKGTFATSSPVTIVSGNVTVPAGQVGAIEVGDGGQLQGQTGTVRKLGGGALRFASTTVSQQLLAVHEGSVELQSNAFSRVTIRDQGTVDATTMRLDVAELVVDEGGQLRLGITQADGTLIVEPHEVDQLNVDGLVVVEGPFSDFASEGSPLTILTSDSASLSAELQIDDPEDSLRSLKVGGSTVQPVWSLTADGTNLDLAIVRGIEGDANLDGRVDFADFLIVSHNFGEAADDGWLDGNFSGAGVTGFADFLDLSDNYGRTGFRTAASAAASVPEPTDVCYLFGACFASSLFRRRSHRSR